MSNVHCSTFIVPYCLPPCLVLPSPLGKVFPKSDDLPPGWREAVTSAEYSGGTLTHKYFMSPNGTILKSRALSIKYMMDKLFERSHIETMFCLLKSEDGWQNDENLPEGWMKKQMPSVAVFMSPTLEIFKK